MNLTKLQAKVHRIYRQRGYAETVSTLCLGVTEEVGELAEAVLVSSCPDYVPSTKKIAKWKDLNIEEHIACEIGDIIIYLLAICCALGIEPKFDEKFRE